MKQLLTILSMFLCVFSYSQAGLNLNVALKYQIQSSSGSSPNFIVSGFVSDDLSRWDATNVLVGDSLYVLDGSDLFVLRVQSISVAAGNSLTMVVNDASGDLGAVPFGQAAIIHPTADIHLPTYVSGLSDDLRSAIMNRLSQLADKYILNNTTAIYDSLKLKVGQGLSVENDTLKIGQINSLTTPNVTEDRIILTKGSNSGVVNRLNKDGDYSIVGYKNSSEITDILSTNWPTLGGVVKVSGRDTFAYFGTITGFSSSSVLARPELLRLQVNVGGIVLNTIIVDKDKTTNYKIVNYSSKLHSNYTNRTLVDKEYVVNYIDTTKLALSQLEQTGATVGQVIKWNGTQWAPGTDSGGGGGSGDDWGTQVVIRDSSLTGTGIIGSALGLKGYSAASNGQIPSKSAGGITWVSSTSGSGATNQLVYWSGTTTQAGNAAFTVNTSTATLSVLGTVSSNKVNTKYETVTSTGSTISGNYSIVYCNIGTAGASVTLPLDANIADGDFLTVFNLNATVLDVSRNGSNQTINGGTTISDMPQYAHITLQAKITGPTITWLRYE